MEKSTNCIYCFSTNELQLEAYEAPSLFSEILNLTKINFNDFYKQYINNEIDIETEALWRFNEYNEHFGENYKHCYKFFNYDPKKLLTFRIKHDTVKICRIPSTQSLQTLNEINSNLRDFNDAEDKFESYYHEIQSAINDFKELKDEFNEIEKMIENLHEKITNQIRDKFNKTFCQF
jgi:chromosome segregation ATPase